jgi:hypothetical protein
VLLGLYRIRASLTADISLALLYSADDGQNANADRVRCLKWVIRVGSRRSRYERHVRFGPFATDLLRPSNPPVSAMSCREQMQQHRSQTYSITSSARASSSGGISKPNAFAVAILITSSNLVPISTGRSPAFSRLAEAHLLLGFGR